MAQTNYAALGKGLDIYREAMRELIHNRLATTVPNRWWEQGVLRAVPRQVSDSLKRDREQNPDRPLIDLIDAQHFRAIVGRNRGAFERDFPKFAVADSYLAHAGQARNQWAHPLSDDILADDAAYALYAMAQLLAMAKLPEAKEVEAIRKRVLHIEDVPMTERGPATAAVTLPAATGALPYWWQVCEPREGFRDPGQVDEGLFAATLGGVFAGAARAEYLDPTQFLAQTYFTENLTQMTRDVVNRLNGGEGAAVTEVQTPFGGGKTHALLTLYHLVNSPNEALALAPVREVMNGRGVPEDARVLVFDGQEAGGDSPVTKEDGATVATLWGELAHQALGARGFSSLVGEADSSGTAPGNAVFRQVLEAAAPCLILLDELVSYLVKLKFSSSRRSQNLYRQTVQFLQETLQLAGNVPGVCVLLSLPKSRREFGGIDPTQLQRELEILDELQPRADRVVSKRTPVNDDEIYELTRQRLFQSVDENAARRIARAYREVYERTSASYDPAVTSTDYLQRLEDAWPLHPELLDVIYKKWSTASDFPRTRATLQLLASVVADQWRNRREAHAIQPAHIDLERERIRTRIVSAAGAGGGYEGVVAADIVGGDGHANREDERRGGDYARLQVARGVATTLLAHSFGGQTQRGATGQEIRLGSVAPNLGPEYISEVLGTLEETLWYVHKEGDRLGFLTRPNIYRVIAESATNQSTATVDERLRDEVERAIGAPQGFRTVVWAGATDHIPDNPDPTVAVLSPRFAVSGAGGGKRPAGADRVEELWDKVGGGFRQWRNALVLVATDQELWERAGEAVREVLAYESVLASRLDGLSSPEVEDLKTRAKDKQSSLATSVATAYRWVFYPEGDGLVNVPLAVPATADERIAQRAVERLSSQDYGEPKVLTGMGALYFNAKVAPHLWKDEGEALELGKALRRFPQWTYLPMLPSREETFRACIRDGVSTGLWAVAIGDAGQDQYQRLVEGVTEFDGLVSLFDGSASLVKGEFLELIREGFRPKSEAAPPDVGKLSSGSKESQPEPQKSQQGRDGEQGRPVIPPPARRLKQVRLSVADLAVAKANNLQPYLFRVLQQHDAAAEVQLSILVNSEPGIPADVLESRIVEAFDQLGISVSWEEA